MYFNLNNIERDSIHIYWLQLILFKGTKQEGESKLPPGHPVSASGQAVASKCPFLAAEMGQKNSSVVRQVSMEFQEDVQEVRTVKKGESYKGVD